PGPYFRLPFGLCSSPCAQTTLQLLACRGRSGSLLGHAIDLRGLPWLAVPAGVSRFRVSS
ncbi:hypothetical protein, partial [Sporolactobacillus terrae]